ncbi:MAG: helix-turn-helix domain-containing protein [Actinobacteria bacterium]|nr:helix-turn-helix domain-containing protein [Actinomycetota bacterium]
MTGGQFVLEARRRAGLTQRQLAARSGLSQPEIARIESGTVSPSFGRILRLVRACGFDLAIQLVRLDQEDEILASQNERRSPDQRLDGLLAGLRFFEAGRKARAELDA